MNQENYTTTDLALASYLSIEGFGIVSINGFSSKKEIVFGRKQGTKIEDVIEKYNYGKALVDPRKYFDELRFLKSRIYENM